MSISHPISISNFFDRNTDLDADTLQREREEERVRCKNITINRASQYEKSNVRGGGVKKAFDFLIIAYPFYIAPFYFISFIFRFISFHFGFRSHSTPLGNAR